MPTASRMLLARSDDECDASSSTVSANQKVALPLGASPADAPVGCSDERHPDARAAAADERGSSAAAASGRKAPSNTPWSIAPWSAPPPPPPAAASAHRHCGAGASSKQGPPRGSSGSGTGAGAAQPSMLALSCTVGSAAGSSGRPCRS